MGLKIVTPPTVKPIDVVGLDLIKNHLHEAVDVNEEDELITAYVDAAWQLAELHTWRQFLTTTYTLNLWHWRSQCPDKTYGRYFSAIHVPRPATQSITEIRYIDTSNNTTVLDPETYDVDDSDDVWKITPAYGKCWPGVRRHPNAVQIDFVAGYGETLDDMPSVLMHAIRLQVADWYLNREDTDTLTHKELPKAAKALLEAIEIRDDQLVTNEPIR